MTTPDAPGPAEPGSPAGADRPAHEQAWLAIDAPRRWAWWGYLRSHAQITTRLDAELQERAGLSLAEYDVLITLGRSPEGSLRMVDLARRVVLSRSGLTRLVDRLERRGLVARSPDNARRVFVALTPEGIETLGTATPVHLEGVRRLFVDHLSREDARALIDVWRRLEDP